MFIYNFIIYAFQFGLKIVALYNPKAKLWINGRNNWEHNLRQNVTDLNLQYAMWFHCASLGEFEQGRSVIEKLKQDNPKQKIVLTFFSPSGFEIQKNYPYADLVMYLPNDTPYNAKTFLVILKPKLAVFVKYEFWLNYLFQLQQQKISSILISTVIKKHQSFFKWYGYHFKRALATYKVIYTQDEHSLTLLKELNINTGILAGDTRFDRVLQIGSAPKKIKEIEDFAQDSFVIIAGSSWQKDEDILIETYLELKKQYPTIKLIIAPHEIHKKNIDRLKNLLYKDKLSFHLFSDNATVYTHSILIINAVGFLSSIYQYGSVAFIGGGFNNGIHNILEPTVYGLPVLFGPNYKKFNEAFDVIDLKAGFVINDSKHLNAYITKFLLNTKEFKQASLKAKNYVAQNSGATKKIIDGLKLFIS